MKFITGKTFHGLKSGSLRVLLHQMVATELTPIEKAKRDAAYACAKQHVKPGCRLGVGSGSTVRYLVEFLESEYKGGRLPGLLCVPTSQCTKQWLIESGLPLSDLDSSPCLDVCIDGADEVDSSLRIIKGGGGCLAREKIVQHAAAKFLVIADYSKKSSRLGEKYPNLPIEVLPFATTPLCREISSRFGGSATLRMAARKCGPVITDNAGYIIDWNFPKDIDHDWNAIQGSLSSTPGIVETGLFLGVADGVFFAQADGAIIEIKREDTSSP